MQRIKHKGTAIAVPPTQMRKGSFFEQCRHGGRKIISLLWMGVNQLPCRAKAHLSVTESLIDDDKLTITLKERLCHLKIIFNSTNFT